MVRANPRVAAGVRRMRALPDAPRELSQIKEAALA